MSRAAPRCEQVSSEKETELREILPGTNGAERRLLRSPKEGLTSENTDEWIQVKRRNRHVWRHRGGRRLVII